MFFSPFDISFWYLKKLEKSQHGVAYESVAYQKNI